MSDNERIKTARLDSGHTKLARWSPALLLARFEESPS
jgi:hypothetical protein